ncbi:HNH endonuclease [Clostridium sp. YIM B02505]|uniref:HNH endonuclease n=1 Tax=Clostridium yunnanense TaxID=2800325 RepID=A0ABS1EJ95_9CLOT|nr:HNH endonuclease [Clostridium yunnanense]MBK1809441.1 HNH endonuclease [Clostridium yunnanense]
MSKYHEELLKLGEKDEDSAKALLMKAHVSAIADMKNSIGDYLQTNENTPFAKQLELKKLDKLLDQMNDILGKIYDKNYNTIAAYGKSTFNREYFGVFYEVEGILNSKLNFDGLEEEEIKEVLETPVAGLKLSERLYDKHLNDIKLKVKGAVTEGLINNKGYGELAKNLSDIGNSSYNNNVKIAVTEAGRIKSLAKQKGLEEAVKSGVSLKKKWIAVSDKKTRVDHQQLNGQVVDIDEKFYLHGYSASQPRLFGVAKEDIGCRCDCETVVEEAYNEATNSKESIEAKKYENFDQWYKDRVNNNERLDGNKYNGTSSEVKNPSVVGQDKEEVLDKNSTGDAGATKYTRIDNVIASSYDKSGKLVKRWVVPKGFSNIDDFLSKVDNDTIKNYGYNNIDDFINATENVNRYLNESISNTIINQSLAGSVHKNGLDYDILGFPIFKGDNLKFEFDLPKDLTISLDYDQFVACTKALEKAIIDGKVSESIFSSNQLQDIIDGMPRIEGLTWHHHQVTGKMQLVDSAIHQANHLGGNAMWGGRIR